MTRCTFVAGLALLLTGTAGTALSAAIPATRIGGDVTFVSGGIGVAEQERLKAREKEFNLKLVFTLTEGNYVADVGVVLMDAEGRKVIEDVAVGPFFLAKLSPGTYSVSASYNGHAQSRKVTVGKALRTEYLRWPADPRTDFAVREDGQGGRAAAPKAQPLPDGEVSYVSGGVGEDALAELKAKEPQYNLKFVFTLVEGNYVADVGVALKSASGKTVLGHVAEGPIFLARLPAGTYSAVVDYGGRSQTRSIKVGEKLRTEYFRWPSDPETDLAVSRWLEPPAGAKSKTRQ